MKFFGGTVFSGGVVTCPVDDPTPLAGAEVSLDKLPREYYAQNQEGIALLVAGKIGDQGPGAGCDGPVTKIARDLRVHKRGQHLVTLVDFKAGLEDSARGVITSLDWIIVVIDPTIAAIQIASDMKDMVKQIKAGAMPATAHLHDPQRVESATRLYRKANIKGVLFVLNNVIDDGTENYLKKRLNVKEIEPIGTIHSDSSIAMAWLKGTLLEGEKIKKDVERIAGELESAEQAYSIIAPPLL
jgi:CO dehydrogenase nickel-insertion accessory protein CooC1